MAKTADPAGLQHDAVPVAVNTARPEAARPRSAIQPDRDHAGVPPTDGAPAPARSAQVIARMPGGGAPSRARMMNGFQASAGNARVGRLAVQAKLAVSHPDDQYEREADQVATKVARMPASSNGTPPAKADEARKKVSLFPGRAPSAIARLAHPDSAEAGDPRDRHLPAEQPVARPAETPVQRRVDDASREEDRTGGVSRDAAAPAPASVEGAMEARIQSPSGGRPLPDGMRRDMEHGIGADFSNVRVHDTAADRTDADKLNAKAFTHGSDIWIGSSGSASDRQLMAHELTHVVQQGGDVRRQTAADDASAFTEVEPEPDVAPETSAVGGSAAEPAGLASGNDLNGRDALDAGPPNETTPPAAPESAAASAPTDAAAAGGPAAPPSGLPSTPASDRAGASGLPAQEPAPPDAVAFAAAPAALPADRDVAMSGDHAAHQPPIDTPPTSALPVDEAGAAPPVTTAMPAPPIATSAPPAGGSLVQRDDNGDDGLLGGVRSRINSIVGGLREGWTSIGEMARTGFDTVRTQASSLVTAITSTISVALTVLQSTWTSITQQVTTVVKTVQRHVETALGGIFAVVGSFARAILGLDAAAIRAAWGRLTALVGGLNQRIQQAAQAIAQTIAGLWQGLRGRFDALLNGLTTRGRELFAQVQGLVQAMRQRLSAGWAALQNRATQLSGVLGGILERLRRFVSQLIDEGQRIWSGIREQWGGLTSRLGALVESIGQRVGAVVQQLRQRAATLWTQLQGLWTRLQAWVKQQVQRVLGSVGAIWSSLQRLSIAGLLQKISALSTLMRLAQEVFADLRAFLTPTATTVTNRVYAGMPGSAIGFAREQAEGVLGTLGPVGEAETDAGPQAGAATIQRQPRDTAGFGDIWAGFWKAIKDMWEKLTWKSFLDMVLDMLLEQLFPFIAIWKQGKAFIFEDLAALVDGLFMPRNIFTDPLGSLHDIWTNLLHIITDFYFALLRRVINILMAFMLWITVALTIIGAVGGAVAVGILGGILGALFGVGIGAGPGAAAGAGAGGAAGAGVGFGAALLIGEAMFFAYLLIHGATILALLVQLKTGRQTDQEKRRDYAQLAESAVAVGVGLLLLFLAWLAGTISKGVAALIERLGIKPQIQLPPAVSRFLKGVGSVQKPKPGGPTTGQTAAALAAEQRLAGQVGGAIARDLVADLGPEAAESLVARIGSNRVKVAVEAGQYARMIALTNDQVAKLAALSDSGFERIINLPEGKFQRFANLGEAQLRAFADMNPNGFNRFVALDDAAFARFGGMQPRQLEAFAAMSDNGFGRFAAMDAATFGKVNTLDPAALARWGGLSDAAFADVEGLLRSAKVRDAAQLEGLLTNPKVQDVPQLQGLLADPKVVDAAQLDALLADAKIADAAELERLLGSAKIRDAAQVQDLLARYQSGQQLEDLLGSADVASGDHLARVADVMNRAGIPNATTGGLTNEAIARFSRPDILGELEATAALQDAGAVRGLDGWIRFGANKDTPDLLRSVGELRDARRLAAENPGTVINVAGDANAPLRPGTADPMQSFDMTVEDPATGAVRRSVEVTTVDAAVSQVGDLTPGVRHAADKAASRIADGSPIPGQLDTTIRMELDVGTRRVGGVDREILADGTVNLRRPDTGAIVRTSNLFRDFEGNLPVIGNNGLLNRVTLVDKVTGAVIAEFERGPAGWVRIR